MQAAQGFLSDLAGFYSKVDVSSAEEKYCSLEKLKEDADEGCFSFDLVEGGGHFLPYENPAGVAKSLSAFLRKNEL